MGQVIFSGTRDGAPSTELISTTSDSFLSTVLKVTVARRYHVDDDTYTYNVANGIVYRYLMSDLTQTTLAVADASGALAIGSGNDLWVPRGGSTQELGRIDRSTFTLINSYGSLNVLEPVTGIAWDGATTIYLTSRPTSSSTPLQPALTVFTTTTNTVSATYTLSALSGRARNLAVLSGNGYVGFDANSGADRLLKVDLSTGSVTGTCNLLTGYDISDVRTAGGYIFVTGLSSTNVYRIDPTTMTIVNTYTIGSANGQPRITTDGDFVWCSASNTSTVTKISGSTGTTTAIVRPGVPATAGGFVQYMSGEYGTTPGLSGIFVGAVVF